MIKKLFYYIIIIVFSILNNIYAVSPKLSVHNNRDMTIISVNNQIHTDYGLSYPITYEFSIPQNLETLNSYRKFQFLQYWELIEEKTDQDFFNGIEAVRFDYDENIAYLSVGFSSVSDSIFIKFTDVDNNDINVSYIGTSSYYDNRKAVVTITGDDWADYCNEKFVQSCQNFRSYNLWYSVAVITGSGWNQNSWEDIQNELDLGLIEVVSHSRTHPYTPYIDVEGEVLGSKQDLFDNLELSGHNSSGDNEYIYAWVAPYGDYDDAIDTMTSIGKYLVSRLFYWDDNDFSEWNDELLKFNPTGASIEVGSSYYWGSTNINELNGTFDNVVESNGIYHLMTHPNILQWDEDFTWDHIEHISNKKDIWYVGFGHLYLYRFLAQYQEYNLNNNDKVNLVPNDFKIIQNYPNPFNPITTMKYNLPKETHVKITVYDIIGREIKNLINTNQTSGYKSIIWDGTNDYGEMVSGGMYFYTLNTNTFSETKKMILLK
mgnify:CR=1 FL=1